MDTSAVSLRQIEPDDAERLGRLFQRLSPRTVYLRFFSPVPAPSEPMLRRLAVVDHDRRQALVALADGEAVGVARYDRDPADPERAEVAVVDEDAWQGRGLGKVLLTGLAEDAQRHGVKVLTASVLGENHRALELARKLAPASTVRLDRGEWLLDVPLNS